MFAMNGISRQFDLIGELRNQRREMLIPCELRATYGYAPCGLDAQEP